MTSNMRTGEHSIAALIAPDIVALLRRAPLAVAAQTEELHPADLADVAETLSRQDVVKLLSVLPRERAADVLEYLQEELRTEVLEMMSAFDAAQIVTQMTPDDRADVIENLEEGIADGILSEIPAAARAETERLLAYDPDSAGGIMTTEFVASRATDSVEKALLDVRAAARSGRREALYNVYVVDDRGHLLGVLSLRELLAAPEGSLLMEVAREDVVSVAPAADREEVARLTREYDLVAVPVAEPSGRLVGVVTVDDVLDVIEEELTEDVQRLGAMEPLDEPYFQAGFWNVVRKRGGWLTLLFVGTTLTVNLLSSSQAFLAGAATLALFLPLIVSSGGNSGAQSSSLITRGLAVGDIAMKDWLRVLGRELSQGLLLGAWLGLLGFLRVIAFPPPGGGEFLLMHVATIVALTVTAVVLLGSVVGAALPLLLRRIGVDPAIASSPFIASSVDIFGILLYLAIARAILGS